MAQYFITCRGFSGAHPGRGSAGRERITRALIDPNVFSAGAEQLSMFAPPAVDRLVEQGRTSDPRIGFFGHTILFGQREKQRRKER